ncbi:zeta toxin family protein [Streptomyces sp. NBC_00470]|uniref:zeta toxin family protein n=1 Tax=Streptomyces sp. NBC_00470 TaxID=2975753 RepID=UPI002F908A5E
MNPLQARTLTAEEERFGRDIFEEQIAPAHLAGLTPQHSPVAVIVNGPTGAGKTAVTRMVKQALDRRGRAAWVNMDFYNPHHPRYAQWQADRPEEADALVRPFGDLWWALALQYALSHSSDIVIESASVTPAEFEDICRNVQTAPRTEGMRKYNIEAAFVAEPGFVSELGTVLRKLAEIQEVGHGRRVDPAIHDASVQGVLRGATAFEAEGLGDFAAVMRRSGITVDTIRVASGTTVPPDQLRVVQAIRNIHTAPLSPADAAQFTARLAMAQLTAPDSDQPQLERIAHTAAPQLPGTHWTDILRQAADLRANPPAAADTAPELLRYTGEELITQLAAALADRHHHTPADDPQSPQPAAEPAERDAARARRILTEIARRHVLSPTQQADEARHRIRVRVTEARIPGPSTPEPRVQRAIAPPRPEPERPTGPRRYP